MAANVRYRCGLLNTTGHDYSLKCPAIYMLGKQHAYSDPKIGTSVAFCIFWRTTDEFILHLAKKRLV